MARPEEVMAIIDQAQERLGEDFDLLDLFWDAFDDILESVQMAAESILAEKYAQNITNEVSDYLSSHYGE